MPLAASSARAKSGHRRWLSSASGNSGSSPGSVSTAAASIPAAAQLAPRPAAPRSYTVTRQPACASRQAMPRPTTPAPMTMVFGGWDGTIDGALMTDSLHRACPARFSGSDLSRLGAQATPRRRAAPQPHANFKPSPSAMQGFSAEGALKPRRFHRGARSARAVNLLAMFVGHALPHALLCGTRCPHGHPPLSLEAAFGGLLFFQRGRLWRPPFLSVAALSFHRRKQFLLGRGIDAIALDI